MNRTRLLSAALILSLLFCFALPSYAAESTPANLEIKLKVGSKQMTVNGKTSAVTAPYMNGSTVMVPLNVATKGMGAKLSLKNNKIITLSYLKHSVIVTLNSKAATFDGKKTTLPASPVTKSGVTMIPTKVIEGLGAKVGFDKNTKDIRITADASSDAGASAGGIDTDAGKNKIGDSYYGWSMNLPTVLAQTDQSANGDYLEFQDVKGEYYLSITVEEAEEPMTLQDRRDVLTSYSEDYGTLVDVKTMTGSSGSFERVVVKSSYGGFYYELRGMQANGYFYVLIYGKKAKSASELNSNGVLLDSFRTTFDRSNKALKDLTKIKDGMISFDDEDYGLKLQLPKDWSRYRIEAYPYFRGPKGSYALVKINSVQPGDTLDAWVNRRIQFYKDTHSADFFKEPAVSDVTWNGVAAKSMKISYSTDKKVWWDQYEIFAINGNYKYYVEMAYNQDQQDELGGLFGKLNDGMKIDFAKVEKTFGQVPDADDAVRLSDKVTKTNKTYGYSITVPKLWKAESSDFDSEDEQFSGMDSGIFLQIAVEPNSGMEGYPEMLEQQYTDSGLFKLTSKTTTTFAGVLATKLLFESTKNFGSSAKLTVYLLENKGNVYLVQGGIQDAYASELNKKLLEESLNSFKFN